MEKPVMGKSIVLSGGDIAERWSIILVDMQGNTARLYRSTAAGILSSNLPDISIELAKVRPSYWSREERDFLLVANQAQRFKESRILIGATDYGTTLAVSWYLLGRLYPGDLTLFQQQEFEAFVTVTDRCLKQAIADLLHSAGQDPSVLAPAPHGFLGIT
jgi:hypothetical protein